MPESEPQRKTEGLLEIKATGQDAELRHSYIHCGQLIRREIPDLYLALRLTPQPRRAAAFAIHAWIRRLQEEADSDSLVEARRVGLARLREMTERALAGDPVRHADTFSPAFAETISRYQIPEAWIHAILDGKAWDLGRPAICEDEAALELYGYRVGSVPLMIDTTIWGLAPGAEPAEALELAKRRGLALRLTTALRDFARDYDGSPRRQYIPQVSLDMADLKATSLRAWMPQAGCEEYIRGWARTVRDVFESSTGLEPLIRRDCRRALRTITGFHMAILDIVEAEPARVVRGKRATVPGMARARLVLASAAGRFRG